MSKLFAKIVGYQNSLKMSLGIRHTGVACSLFLLEIFKYIFKNFCKGFWEVTLDDLQVATVISFHNFPVEINLYITKVQFFAEDIIEIFTNYVL